MAYTTINKSTDHFNTVSWTGTSSSPLNVTGFGHNPDMIWNKYRAGAGDHQLYDAVRTATKMVLPNGSAAESTNANGVTSFISDGFTAGSDINVNGGNSVAWGWKANGAGSANTDGSINSTATSANTTSGVSIVKYTGTGSAATVGHGLGVAPEVIIVKRLDSTSDWSMYWKVLGANKYIYLNDTAAVATDSSSEFWNNTAPTSTVFSVKSAAYTNGSGNTYVAYCFAQKTGFSKFGSYTGNGNANGTFIYTGFKPSLIIIKRSDASAWWSMFNDKSLGYNPDNNALFPSSNDAENTSNFLDIVSNGFKLRDSNTNLNNSGSTHIFMAFAKAPLVGSNNIPATAR